MRRVLLLIAGVCCLSACASGGVISPYAGAGEAIAGAQPVRALPELLLFGGTNHDVFLGCLTCSQYDAASVRNPYGQNGSRHSATSVHNPYGEYGSRHGVLSPCNPYAVQGPVIVDRSGNYYGELTINVYNSRRTRIQSLLTWIAAVCGP